MGLVRHDAPQTSVDADARNAPREGTQRAKVLAALQAAYPRGLTDEELQSRLAMNPNTERPRRIELVRDGWVTDSGETRPTSASGSDSIVWQFVPYAPEPVCEVAGKPIQGVLF